MSILHAGTSLSDMGVTGGVLSSTAQHYEHVAESVLCNYNVNAIGFLPVFEKKTDLWFTCYVYYHNNVSTNQDLIRFYDRSFNGTQHVFALYRQNSSGAVSIRAYNGSSMQHLATTAGSIGSNTLTRVDIHLVLDDTTGVAEIYLDGTLAWSFEGDTITAGYTGIDQIAFSVEANNRCYYSAWIVADEDTRTMYMSQSKPTGAGSTSDWTGAYTDLDETSFDDSDFIETTTEGAVSTFAKTALPTNFETGHEIAAIVIAARAAAAPSRVVQAAVRVGGTNYASEDIGAPTAFGQGQAVLVQNPATEAAWTFSEADAAEIGVKLAAA